MELKQSLPSRICEEGSRPGSGGSSGVVVLAFIRKKVTVSRLSHVQAADYCHCIIHCPGSGGMSGVVVFALMKP